MPSTYAPASSGHSNSYAPAVGPGANGGTWSSALRSKKPSDGTPKRSGPPSFAKLRKTPSPSRRAPPPPRRLSSEVGSSTAGSTLSDDASSVAGLDAAEEALRAAEAEYEAARRDQRSLAAARRGGRREERVRRSSRTRSRSSNGGMQRLPSLEPDDRHRQRASTPSSVGYDDGAELEPEPEQEPESDPEYDDEGSEPAEPGSEDEIAEEVVAVPEHEDESSDDEREGNLKRFLTQARLGHYSKKLSALGAATTDDLFELGPEELEEVGMRKLERTRLARFLQRYVLARPRLQEEGREVPDSLFGALAAGQKPLRLLHGWLSRTAQLRQRLALTEWRWKVRAERLSKDLEQATAAETAATQSRALLRSSFDKAAAALGASPSQAVDALARLAATGEIGSSGAAAQAVGSLTSQLQVDHWEAEEVEAAAAVAENAAAALALPLPEVADALRPTHVETTAKQQQAEAAATQLRPTMSVGEFTAERIVALLGLAAEPLRDKLRHCALAYLHHHRSYVNEVATLFKLCGGSVECEQVEVGEGEGEGAVGSIDERRFQEMLAAQLERSFAIYFSSHWDEPEKLLELNQLHESAEDTVGSDEEEEPEEGEEEEEFEGEDGNGSVPAASCIRSRSWQQAHRLTHRRYVHEQLHAQREFGTAAQILKDVSGHHGGMDDADSDGEGGGGGAGRSRRQRPVVRLLGGGMAAGKSSVVRMLKASWGQDCVVVEADNFKMLDPIFQQLSKDEESSTAAQVVHEHSTTAATEELIAALEQQRDVVMDGTMTWLPYVEQTVAMIRGSHKYRYRVGPGWQPQSNTEVYYLRDERPREDADSRLPYLVEMTGVTVDPALAVGRGLRRQMVEGRGVPVRPQLRSHQLYSQHFRTFLPLLDAAELYDTTSSGYGQAELIAAYKCTPTESEAPPVKSEQETDQEHSADSGAARQLQRAPGASGGVLLVDEGGAFGRFEAKAHIDDQANCVEKLYGPNAGGTALSLPPPPLQQQAGAKAEVEAEVDEASFISTLDGMLKRQYEPADG